MTHPTLGDVVTVHVEVPRYSFVKFRADGEVDFISPVPAPLNYGCLPEVMGGDGDPLDALVFGPQAAAGRTITGEVVGVVHFVDHGQVDDKLLVLPPGVRATSWEFAQVRAFFAIYVWVKWGMGLARGQRGRTTVNGIVWRQPLG